VLELVAGQPVEITAAGSWCTPGCAGPDGERPADAGERADMPMPDELIGALIGQIGHGQFFLIGRSLLFAAGESGSLRLLMNDRLCCFGDNSGSIHATIKTWPLGAFVPDVTSPSPTPRPTDGFAAFLNEPLPDVSANAAERSINEAFKNHPGLRQEQIPAFGGTYNDLIGNFFYCSGELWISDAEFDQYSWRCSAFAALCLAYAETSDELFTDAARNVAGAMRETAPAYFDRFVDQSLSWLGDPGCGY
jgi:hypothetical protein